VDPLRVAAVASNASMDQTSVMIEADVHQASSNLCRLLDAMEAGEDVGLRGRGPVARRESVSSGAVRGSGVVFRATGSLPWRPRRRDAADDRQVAVGITEV
jgi:hypothetical protein